MIVSATPSDRHAATALAADLARAERAARRGRERPPSRERTAPASVTSRPLSRGPTWEALGLGRRAVDQLVRALPVVAIPGVRRVYLRRADVEAYLDQHTYADDRVRPIG